ncbi:hypothetical protein [Haloferula sargassicola]|uniref:DUF2157 domain-containing protein n=1 Tax=Haloferula sargassicola TaxID=490096 RepID=A0ABP9UPX2_9BACT
MSPLPERRKSAEELAELRANLGIPDAAPPPPDLKHETPPIPVKPQAVPDPAPAPPPPAEPEEPVERKPHVVKSLKRSERGPVTPPKPVRADPQGKLPTRRHTRDELKRMLMTGAGNAQVPMEHLKHLTARWWTVGFFYLAGGSGLVAPLFLEKRGRPSDVMLFGALAAGALIMLLGAGWIAWRRKRSSHHAGFLLILSILLLTFGILHFFPNLHGS